MTERKRHPRCVTGLDLLIAHDMQGLWGCPCDLCEAKRKEGTHTENLHPQHCTPEQLKHIEELQKNANL